MKQQKMFSIFVAMALVLGLVPAVSIAAPMERKIVVFESQFVNEAAQEQLVAHAGGVKIKKLDLINGMAVYLPSKAAERALGSASGVLRVDDDVAVEALVSANAKGGKPAPAQPSQVLPWGIDRINADLAWATSAGTDIKVAVLDTGIDLTHPDLVANVAGGYNAISPLKSAQDDNGHGTHVAGIIAAENNTIGVVGAGPQIGLYAVKVLDRRGSGYLSDIVKGLDWAVANEMQVVNMSLGTSSNVLSFHEAVQRAHNAGIVLVAAAGNDYGGAVNYPAAYSEVIAVSATDSADNLAYFSSVGPEVDLAAPGVSILSTYKGKTYKTLSGTSMASPHVAGVAALVLTGAVGVYDLDGDGLWDPQEVQNKLEATAEDLGALGRDAQFGAGLVRADQAVQ